MAYMYVKIGCSEQVVAGAVGAKLPIGIMGSGGKESRGEWFHNYVKYTSLPRGICWQPAYILMI